ncbi:MAG: hypothetical protein QOE06_1327, partial [Thermoleophilaceae bacterium]|nr:hypothetical protein [Thermoleophilaceae bacterium]
MSRRRIALGLAVLSLALAGGVSALAATTPPTTVAIRAVTSQKVVINRYVQDG